MTPPREFTGIDYFRKLISIAPANLIGYWPMNEDPGSSVAIDYSGRDNDGAYISVPLGQAGIGDRRTSALFDASNSFNNIYSAGLNTDFDGAEGTLMAWGKVSGAGVWTDATQRRLTSLQVDGNNRLFLYRNAANNRLTWRYEAGGADKNISKDGLTTLDFFHMVITWSASADEVKAYFGGEQEGATLTGLGIWAGDLVNTQTAIGAFDTIPSQVWGGSGAHVALWSTPLMAAPIAELAIV